MIRWCLKPGRTISTSATCHNQSGLGSVETPETPDSPVTANKHPPILLGSLVSLNQCRRPRAELAPIFFLLLLLLRAPGDSGRGRGLPRVPGLGLELRTWNSNKLLESMWYSTPHCSRRRRMQQVLAADVPQLQIFPFGVGSRSLTGDQAFARPSCADRVGLSADTHREKGGGIGKAHVGFSAWESRYECFVILSNWNRRGW